MNMTKDKNLLLVCDRKQTVANISVYNVSKLNFQNISIFRPKRKVVSSIYSKFKYASFSPDGNYIASIGMITSELISNSMKHAFENVAEPTVFLTLKQNSDGTILYLIRDNGKGFDEKEIRENRLGLRLVDIFSRQLKGTYLITGSAGFRYEMTFKKK